MLDLKACGNCPRDFLTRNEVAMTGREIARLESTGRHAAETLDAGVCPDMSLDDCRKSLEATDAGKDG